MATRNIVPRATDEGQLGTSNKRWGAMYSKSIYSDNLVDEYVNVKLYGVKGDGITDDTEALQLAFDIESSLYIPEGTYVISKTIKCSKSMDIKSKGTFIVKSTDNMDSIGTMGSTKAYIVLQFNGADNNTNESTIDANIYGITIKNETDNTIVGIRGAYAFNNVVITNCSGYGLKNSLIYFGTSSKYESVDDNAEGTSLSSINSIRVQKCYAQEGGTGQNPSICHIFSPAYADISFNNAYKSYGYAIRVNGGSYNTIPNTDKGSRNINVHHNNVYGWGTNMIAIQVTKSSGVKVENNTFTGLDIENFTSSDNAVDIFNCWNVSVCNNYVYNGGGLFVGHADLGGGTATNLIGTRNVLISNNTLLNTKNNGIFIGGDGTVGGNKASRNYIIIGNVIRWNKEEKIDNSCIYGFLCNNVVIHNNIFDNYPYVLKSYHNRYLDIKNNLITNITTMLHPNTENDWQDEPTHIIGKNTIIGTADDFLGLTKTGYLYPIFKTSSQSGTVTLKQNRAGKNIWYFQRSSEATGTYTLKVYVPKGTTLLNMKIINDNQAGGGTGTSNIGLFAVHLAYFGTAKKYAVKEITKSNVYTNNYNSGLTVEVTNIDNDNLGNGGFEISIKTNVAISPLFAKLMADVDWYCVQNV